MFNVVLFEPEIPPNTGNSIRLCANTGCRLHLIEPLGFEMDEPRLRRAGLDYREWTDVRVHGDFEAFRRDVRPRRILTFSTHGERRYTGLRFESGDTLLFGPETRGLPGALRDSVPPEHRLTIPLRPGNRSLNLSNAVAVAVYEAWRQLDFQGAAN
ncbi:MAG: tRNA (cytidine(34)-2'-O)-methyltransferase [Gammaproteobacteria bacterium]